MSGFEDQPHPAASETSFQLIAAVENRLTRDQPVGRGPIVGAVAGVIG